MRRLFWLPLVLAAALWTHAPATAKEKITVGIPIGLNFSFADIGFGMELGFFDEEGLEIEIVSLQGSGTLVPQVARKNVTVGLGNPDLVITALGKGDPYPITFVYNRLRRTVYELAVKADSSIQTVADLKGKRLGIGALSWGNIPMMRAVLKEAGIEWGKDIAVMPIGMGPAAWRVFQDGKVDAMAYFTSEHLKIAAAGTPVRILAIPEKYQTMFSMGVMFHNDTLEKNPRLVEGFGRALAKASVACKAAPRACLKGYWRLDPTARPPAGREEAWVDANLREAMADRGSIEYFAGAADVQWGRFLPSSWSQHVEIMHAAGLLPGNDLPLDRIYTNRFVPAFNRFDTRAVEAKALAAQGRP